MSYYEIWEDWSIGLLGIRNHEYYFNIRQNPNQVKKYIKEWIESWEENAEDNEYKFLGSNTDYLTYAKCRIRTNSGIDSFNIVVIKKKGKRETRTALSVYKEEFKNKK